MDVNIKVKKGLQIPAFYLFFIICNMQIGVGVLGVPKYIFKEAKQDAWVSVLIALAYMLIVIFAIFLILQQYKNADIFGIQVDVFGQWVGKFLGTVFLVYYFFSSLSILMTYVEVIQLFIYPTIPAFMMGLLLLSLVVYSVLGGIRVIVGVVFLFFVLTPWILILLYDPITRMDITHFQPVFQASITQLLKGAQETTYTFLGFEILFVIYPFIGNKQKAKLPTYLGAIFTTLIVLATTIISIGYYSPQDFEKIDWIVLRLFKTISYPLLERFDYVVAVEWMMITVPTLILLIWAITHGTKRMYGIRQRTMLFTVATLLLISSSFVKYSETVETLTDIMSKVAFWIVFVYPLVLLPTVVIKKRIEKRKGRAS